MGPLEDPLGDPPLTARALLAEGEGEEEFPLELLLELPLALPLGLLLELLLLAPKEYDFVLLLPRPTSTTCRRCWRLPPDEYDLPTLVELPPEEYDLPKLLELWLEEELLLEEELRPDEELLLPGLARTSPGSITSINNVARIFFMGRRWGWPIF